MSSDLAAARRRRVLLGLVTAALVVAPAGARADTTIAEEAGATPVDAHRGVIAWSSYDPATETYRPSLRRDGAVRRLAIRPRTVPFDIDLGPDHSGRTVAVYSRCAEEPRARGFARRPLLTYARGCDVYGYSLRTRREFRVRGAATPGWSEYHPTVWGSTIVFVRVRERKRRLADAIPRVAVLDTRTGRVRSLFSGPAGEWENTGTRRRPDFSGGLGPSELDLRGSSLVFVTDVLELECGGREDPSEEYLFRTELWHVRFSGARRRLDARCTDDPTLHSPARLGRSVIYVWSFFESRVARMPLAGGARTFARPAHPVDAVAADGRRIVYSGAVEGQMDKVAIREADPLRFAPEP